MKKMRIIAFALAATSASLAQAQQTEYNISGTVADSVKEVMVLVNGEREPKATVSVSEGKFNVTGSEDNNAILTIGYPAGRQFKALMAVNDGTPITLDLTEPSMSGSELNNSLGELQKATSKDDATMATLMEEWRKVSVEDTPEAQERKAEIEEQYGMVEKAQIAMLVDYCQEHKTDITPVCYISTLCYELDYQQLSELLPEDAPYYNHPMAERAKRQLASLAKRLPGLTYTDLTMDDPDGNAHSLSEWVGKGNYILVDFWASWCGPCRMEMPNVVETYNKYNAKGYDVVGISFDSKADAWKNAIDKLGLGWHHISDLKGWQSAAAGIYGVMSIPSNILVDPEGKIVASDLRGNALKEKLAEIYGF